MNKISKSLFAILLVGIVLLSASFTINFEISKNIEILTGVYKIINEHYVDEIDPGKIMRTGIDAMLKSLDPYTVYYSESEIEDYRYQITGKYGGIGSLIRTDSTHVIITEPYEGSPAYKSGLKAGDIILEIDGISAAGKNSSEVSKVLKGSPGTDVIIKIHRPILEEEMEVTVTREEIKVESVPYWGIIENDIGYIKLNKFTQNCGKEVREAYNDLKQNNADLKSIVLDLRGNPGGLLKEAINVSNIFVPKNEEIVFTKGRDESSKRIYKALNEVSNDTIPIVVLINHGSASASEIVSGAIQDLDRGVVVGQRTYGKGLVQTTKPTEYNSQIKLTTAKYYIPSGRCIQEVDYSTKKHEKVPDSLRKVFYTRNGREVEDGRGIKPDYEVEEELYAKITISLMRKNIIFDYATDYYYKHDSIPNVQDFVLTDTDFEDFKEYISDKDYNYKTKTEVALNKLEKQSKEEKYFDGMAEEIVHFQTKLNKNKAKDIEKFKGQILEALSNEIVSRYYFQKGRIQARFPFDPDLKKAIELLTHKENYQALLIAPVENTEK